MQLYRLLHSSAKCPSAPSATWPSSRLDSLGFISLLCHPFPPATLSGHRPVCFSSGPPPCYTCWLDMVEAGIYLLFFFFPRKKSHVNNNNPRCFSWEQWLTPVILATREAEIRRIMVWGQPGQKVHKTPISINSWAWWHVPVTQATAGSLNRMAVQGGLGKKWDPISKITRAKGLEW
jgi:hypothetical protein